jgi:hypothetical protein
VIGATVVLRYARSKAAAGAEWVKKLLSRRSARVVTVAMANKTAPNCMGTSGQRRDVSAREGVSRDS